MKKQKITPFIIIGFTLLTLGVGYAALTHVWYVAIATIVLGLTTFILPFLLKASKKWLLLTIPVLLVSLAIGIFFGFFFTLQNFSSGSYANLTDGYSLTLPDNVQVRKTVGGGVLVSQSPSATSSAFALTFIKPALIKKSGSLTAAEVQGIATGQQQLIANSRAAGTYVTHYNGKSAAGDNIFYIETHQKNTEGRETVTLAGSITSVNEAKIVFISANFLNDAYYQKHHDMFTAVVDSFVVQ